MSTNKAVDIITDIATRIDALTDKERKRLLTDAHAVQHDVKNSAARAFATGIVLLCFARLIGEAGDE